MGVGIRAAVRLPDSTPTVLIDIPCVAECEPVNDCIKNRQCFKTPKTRKRNDWHTYMVHFRKHYHSHFKLFGYDDVEGSELPAILDRLGGTKALDVDGAVDACLVHSLQALGVPVGFCSSGPFYALRDGNRMLDRFDSWLTPTPPHAVRPGKYIVWQPHRSERSADAVDVGHFFAVEVSDVVRVMDGTDVRLYYSMDSMHSADTYTWFKLTSQASLAPEQRAVIACNREAASKRKRLLCSRGHLSIQQLLSITENRHAALQLRDERRCAQQERWRPFSSVPYTPIVRTRTLDGALRLERLNAHSRDRRITFNASQHVYFLDGCVQFPISVSGVWSAYFQKFDANAVINQ